MILGARSMGKFDHATSAEARLPVSGQQCFGHLTPRNSTPKIHNQMALLSASEAATQSWSRDAVRRKAIVAIAEHVETLVEDLQFLVGLC
jgi:hypothetical protein